MKRFFSARGIDHGLTSAVESWNVQGMDSLMTFSSGQLVAGDIWSQDPQSPASMCTECWAFGSKPSENANIVVSPCLAMTLILQADSGTGAPLMGISCQSTADSSSLCFGLLCLTSFLILEGVLERGATYNRQQPVCS